MLGRLLAGEGGGDGVLHGDPELPLEGGDLRAQEIQILPQARLVRLEGEGATEGVEGGVAAAEQQEQIAAPAVGLLVVRGDDEGPVDGLQSGRPVLPGCIEVGQIEEPVEVERARLMEDRELAASARLIPGPEEQGAAAKGWWGSG
ncbi:MAG: hypothetical protein ACE5GW_06360 [Planctomycetota bacterium]